MSTYMVIDADTAEIMRENITSHQLQAAHRLLEATDNRLRSHQVAQNAANARDINARVASHTRTAPRVVKPRLAKHPSSKKQPRRKEWQTYKPVTVRGALLDLGKGFCGAAWGVLTK